MKSAKISLAALALVLGIAASSFTTKATTIFHVNTSAGTSKDLTPAQFDPSLCPTDHPEIVCAQKIKDGVVQSTTVGGYYTGF